MFTIQREMNLQVVQENQKRLEFSEVFFGVKAEYTSPDDSRARMLEGEFSIVDVLDECVTGVVVAREV